MSATAEAAPVPGKQRGEAALRRLARYFREIEAHFSARFGAPLLLSPRDASRVEFWHSLGIPLEAVKRGIDRHFEKMPPQRRRKAVVLSFCENEILDAWEEHRAKGSAGSAPHAAAVTPEERAASLKKYLARLRRARLKALAKEGDWTAPVFDALEGMLEKSSSRKKPPSMEKTFLLLEKRLRLELRRFAPPELMEALRGEVARDLAPYRPRMEAEAYRETLEAQTLERLRERIGLPALPHE